MGLHSLNFSFEDISSNVYSNTHVNLRFCEILRITEYAYSASSLDIVSIQMVI